MGTPVHRAMRFRKLFTPAIFLSLIVFLYLQLFINYKAL